MTRWAVTLLLFSALLAQATLTAAEPIFKPKKYHGPIPQSSFTLRFGFLGGADNQEMIDALDKKITGAEEAFSEDFGTALTIDVAYAYKVHPQFAFRANASASFLKTTSTGVFVGEVIIPPDTLLPQLNYTRDFDVDLFVVEASALYYFADAAIQEFQPYIGGGFSVGMPHAKFKEVRIDDDTGEVFEEFDRDEWSFFEPGVHGLLGASYYVTNVWAFNAEGRVQIMQSSFPVDIINRKTGQFEEVDVIVKYTGFMINFGVSRSF